MNELFICLPSHNGKWGHQWTVKPYYERLTVKPFFPVVNPQRRKGFPGSLRILYRSTLTARRVKIEVGTVVRYNVTRVLHIISLLSQMLFENEKRRSLCQTGSTTVSLWEDLMMLTRKRCLLDSCTSFCSRLWYTKLKGSPRLPLLLLKCDTSRLNIQTLSRSESWEILFARFVFCWRVNCSLLRSRKDFGENTAKLSIFSLNLTMRLTFAKQNKKFLIKRVSLRTLYDNQTWNQSRFLRRYVSKRSFTLTQTWLLGQVLSLFRPALYLFLN